MNGIPEIILYALLILVPCASLVFWSQAALRWRRGEPLVRAEPRAPVPWGLVDLVLMLVLYVVMVGCAVALARWVLNIPAGELEELNPHQQAAVLATYSLATLVTWSLMLLWLRRRTGADLADLGLVPARWREDLRLGALAFAMLIVPVFLVQMLLTRWYPTHHPFIELLRRAPSPSLLVLVALAAVLAAPLFEEYLFRVFLQGWLEKLDIWLRRTDAGANSAGTSALLLGSPRAPFTTASPASHLAPDSSASQSTDETLNPYSPPLASAASQGFSERSADTSGTGTLEDVSLRWFPILVSSALFSVAHFANGPDWMPLFLLALGLGYLYQKTHRVLPCLVVHMLVNALAVLQLWVYVRQEGG